MKPATSTSNPAGRLGPASNLILPGGRHTPKSRRGSRSDNERRAIAESMSAEG